MVCLNFSKLLLLMMMLMVVIINDKVLVLCMYSGFVAQVYQ